MSKMSKERREQLIGKCDEADEMLKGSYFKAEFSQMILQTFELRKLLQDSHDLSAAQETIAALRVETSRFLKEAAKD